MRSIAEDRERFQKLVNDLGLSQPATVQRCQLKKRKRLRKVSATRSHSPVPGSAGVRWKWFTTP